jgi:hypothetical protein
MKNLLNPRYIFIANTLPQAILLLIFYSQFTLVQSQLEPNGIQLWYLFGGALTAIAGVNLLYGLYLTFKQQQIPAAYGPAVLLTYLVYLYTFYYNNMALLPMSLPTWIVPEDGRFYALTFIMPALAHAVFTMVKWGTPDAENTPAWRSFLGAILLPVMCYAVSQLPNSFWNSFDRDANVHLIIVSVIIITVVFLFLLIRTAYILISKKSGALARYKIIWVVLITIALPLLGLAVNNGHILPDSAPTGIFGNFTHPLWYILAFVNGLLLCLPAPQNKSYRALLYFLRCATFAYTTYFFLVFLPFLPLSIMAVAGAGVGFLMLTPLVLMVIHAATLGNDFSYLKNYFSPLLLVPVALAGFLVMPACITGNYLHHRTVLNHTLNYLYNADYNQTYSADTSSLSTTLTAITEQKAGPRDNFLGRRLPYLSTYFNWIVLDNLVLSDSKIKLIKAVFYGEPYSTPNNGIGGSPYVQIAGIKTSSTFDKTQNAWISQLDITLKDTSHIGWQHEYATTFELPTGCWISDYYLYIDSVKEHGILAEKKSAMWVYDQIHNEQQDPGLLHYLTGNRVALSVFPFAQEQTRRTGIEFIHKEPVTLHLDGRAIPLGDTTSPNITKSEQSNDAPLIYVPAKQKQGLTKVQRKPYYHFVVNTSAKQSTNKDEYIRRIEQTLNVGLINKTNAKISFANSNLATYNIDNTWKQNYKEQTCTGGFYLDRAIKTILYNDYTTSEKTYPVIVVVSDSTGGILENDFADFKMAFPESDQFYYLTPAGYLEAHSLLHNPEQPVDNPVPVNANYTVLAYPDTNKPVCYLPDNGEASFVLQSINEPVTDDTGAKEKNWNAALALQADWMAQVLHPSLATGRWLGLVKGSFATHVMMPVTSYLVVENEMQKEALRRKQAQVLSGNKNLDPGEDVIHGSEPGLWLLAALVGLVIWFKERRRLRNA